jgi:Mg-chelatase subunit ChlD
VYEDGVRQELSFFAASELPIDLILLIDHSGSMADKISIAREAALGFLRTMRPVDRAAIVAFNERSRCCRS